MSELLDRVARAIANHLEEQAQWNRAQTPWVDADNLRDAMIDGAVDLTLVAHAALKAFGDFIEAGALAGVEQAVEHGSGEAQHAVEAYRHVIDMIDEAAPEPAAQSPTE